VTFDIELCCASEQAVVAEVIVSGLRLARNMARTSGDRASGPISALWYFRVDDENRVAGEKIHYDRATVLRQLGIFHEPDRLFGRIGTVIMHPGTIARTIWRTALLRVGRH
jgi:hypothetical protein